MASIKNDLSGDYHGEFCDTEDGSIFTYDYELAEGGSRLTPEFVAFLKEED
ncbi:MAG: hypothetical protein K2O38_06100 [Muribaculaceae bacterium]|nr:hypothetical protein [Muribaculaceae bacterium]MDE7111457.1 hypothetical protein [Muribaculaceae bacterium]